MKNNDAVSVPRRRLVAAIGAVLVGSGIAGPARAGAYDDFFRAVKMNDVKTVSSLLARGLDPNLIEPERGETGLMIALREESMKVFDVLLASNQIDLEVKAFNGDNALMIAALKGNLRAVQALIERGAEINKTGWTPLHYAAFVGNNDIVKLLLDQSAYIDAESPNKTTPIMMAARAGHIYTVKLLLDEGADATLKNDLGMTAIDFANKYEFEEIAEGLTHRLRKAGKLQ